MVSAARRTLRFTEIRTLAHRLRLRPASYTNLPGQVTGVCGLFSGGLLNDAVWKTRRPGGNSLALISKISRCIAGLLTGVLSAKRSAALSSSSWRACTMRSTHTLAATSSLGTVYPKWRAASRMSCDDKTPWVPGNGANPMIASGSSARNTGTASTRSRARILSDGTEIQPPRTMLEAKKRKAPSNSHWVTLLICWYISSAAFTTLELAHKRWSRQSC